MNTPSSSNGGLSRGKVMNCWLGKAVGGTLGMPFEGADGPLNLTFYEPVPSEMLPNDDLDLQVLWACVLDRLDAPRVDRHLLAAAWRDHVDFPFDEYGVALRNMRNGLRPPLTGSFDNWFVHGMGAAIRSELWACLAPGNPKLAAAYAYEDACVDHDGEGIWAAMFLAALESAAFVESDSDRLLEGALAELPARSLVRDAIERTRQWWRHSGDWRAVREQILERYGHENFTDVTMNLAFIVLGWLAGHHDFSRAICIATNCGKDTDCTAATVGALMGILHPGEIPARWLDPIGRDLVLSPQITGIQPPRSLDDFTDMVLRLRDRLNGRAPQPPAESQSAAHLAVSAWTAFGPASWLESGGQMELPLRPFSFPGTQARMSRRAFTGEVLLVSYPFTLSAARRVRVMFNTRERCRVWLDGTYRFGRDGGVMTPSFHRVPRDQFADLDLTAGPHELRAAIARPSEDREAEWVVGIGDAVSKQWLPDVFPRREHPRKQ